MNQCSDLEPSQGAAWLPWPQPLRFARLEGRENRFVLRCQGPEPLRAFLPNTGRMTELLVPGATVGLLPASRQGATRWDAVIVRYQGIWVAIDNRLTERLVGQALANGTLPGWEAVTGWRAEVRLGAHRFDFAAAGPPAAWLEVKGSNLVIDGLACFPGAPSARAAAHARLLAERASAGDQAGIVFVVARSDACGFMPHDEMDPAFGQALRAAAQAGVRIQALPCEVGDEGVRLWSRPLPVDL